jgi:hypothetical protein
MKPSLVPYEDYLEVKRAADRAVELGMQLEKIATHQQRILNRYQRRHIPFVLRVAMLAMYTFVLIRFM